MNILKITEIIGTPNAILHKFGLQLFENLDKLISEKKVVTVSFLGVENLTSGFLNASFGNLYKKHGTALEKLLFLSELNDEEWRKKFEEAKLLALNPEKAQLIDAAIADLFE